MPAAWPVGSVFVLLNGVPNQIGLRSSDRDVQRHFRIGPAHRGYDDPAYEHLVETFEGTGLRPYPPAHLEANSNGADVDFSWIRRTRSDGDDWGGAMCPLAKKVSSILSKSSLAVTSNVKFLVQQRNIVTCKPTSFQTMSQGFTKCVLRKSLNGLGPGSLRRTLCGADE